MNNTPRHIPVLLEQVVAALNPQPGDAYFDGTAGYGSHAAAIIERIGPQGSAILVDRDRDAVAALRKRLGESARILQRDYASALQDLIDEGNLVDMALLDLGVSSPQIDEYQRGFSFRAEGPLDMRMDNTSGLTAADIINTSSESDLADIIYRYGEERNSRRIAAMMVRMRPFKSTKSLAEAIAKILGHHEKIHPATRTFQALRIYVNGELDQLREALPNIVRLLRPGGRMAIISFHSLEDRMVKEFIARESRDCICPPKQPICTCSHVASLRRITARAAKGTEDTFNPRARSAKLRAAAKINTKTKENT